jgi:ABC-2 type transport system permease protein
MNTLRAELGKAVTLPATLVAVVVGLFGTAAVTALNSLTVHHALTTGRPDLVASTAPLDIAFAAMPLGTVAAVIIGVTTISSEYTANRADAGGGRQISTTLAAVPHRMRLLTAKVLTVVLLVVAMAVVAIPVTVGLAHAVIGPAGSDTVPLGEAFARGLGGTLYWTLTALLALAITVLTRSGLVPLIVLIVNSSLVSVSLLLLRLTPWANWLPDLAGRRLFGGLSTVEGGPSATPGAVVMAGWSLGLLVIAGAVFARRDA